MRVLFAMAAAVISAAQLVPLESTANAQQDPSPSALALAQKWTDDGLELGRQGKWADALQKFKAAANIHITAQLEFYIGVSESRVKQVVEAGVDLRRAIEMARSAGITQVETAANAELADADARTPYVTIVVPATAKPTSLTVDGSPVSVAVLGAPLPLDAGDHTLIVGFANGNTTKTVTVHETQKIQVEVEVPTGPPLANDTTPPGGTTQSGSSAGTGQPAPDTGTSASNGSSTKTAVGWTLVAVGAAGLITSGVFLGLDVSALSSNSSLCPNDMCPGADRAQIASNSDTARSRQVIAGVTGGIGAVAAGIGIYLLATSSSGSKANAATSSPAPPTVSPWLGPGLAGAGLTASF